jgi:hypothetical protein
MDGCGIFAATGATAAGTHAKGCVKMRQNTAKFVKMRTNAEFIVPSGIKQLTSAPAEEKTKMQRRLVRREGQAVPASRKQDGKFGICARHICLLSASLSVGSFFARGTMCPDGGCGNGKCQRKRGSGTLPDGMLPLLLGLAGACRVGRARDEWFRDGRMRDDICREGRALDCPMPRG